MDFDTFVTTRSTATTPLGTSDYVPVVQGGVTTRLAARNLSITAPGTGLTATGSGQSDGLALTAKYNQFTTVAAGTASVLPVPVAGDLPTVIFNQGANQLAVFPSTGVSIDAGSANAAGNPIAAGAAGIYYPISSSLWLSGNL
jgi:hypothetical protein